VLHLAAAGTDASREFGEEGAAVNLLGTLHMVRLAQAWGAERFVHAGSGFEYGSGESHREMAALEPVGAYAASKAAGSLAVQAVARQSGFPAVILRPFTLYGPGETGALVVSRVAAALLRGEPIELTSGDQRRDFVYVEDAAEAFLAAGVAVLPPGDAVNVCTGVAVSIRSVVVRIGRSLARPDLLIFGARPASSRELHCNSGNPAKAEFVLGWRARTALDQGLQRTLTWWRARITPVGQASSNTWKGSDAY
jgi:nucleoside-diphosphate-sugar epimerase